MISLCVDIQLEEVEVVNDVPINYRASLKNEGEKKVYDKRIKKGDLEHIAYARALLFRDKQEMFSRAT